MDQKEIEERLRHWKRRHGEIMAVYRDLNKLTGAMPDSALMRPVFDVWMAYTVAVSKIIGDRDEWLQWYETECDMGRSPKEAILPDGRKLKVKTLRQLALVIVQ